MSETLSLAGQTSIAQGIDGITLTDENTKNQMRLIGGAILMSVQDENGNRKWVTGLTPEGITASRVTTGILKTNSISIMNANEWINLDRTVTSSKRYYAHFDLRTDIGQQKEYILSADKVAAHSFYPF